MKTLKCETCGVPFEVKPYREKTARFCSSKCWTTSPESKKIVSVSQIKRHNLKPITKGNNPNWKGGIVSDAKLRLCRSSWKKLTKRILEIYNNTCRYCGNMKDLHVHHILPFRDGGLDIEDNLELVCSKCHPKVEKEGVLQRIINKKCEQCMGYFADGRQDCRIPDCPLYTFRPYKDKAEKKATE
jgi:hypothetical protein